MTRLNVNDVGNSINSNIKHTYSNYGSMPKLLQIPINSTPKIHQQNIPYLVK